MIPLVNQHRANIPGGLWVPKLGGQFKDGDSLCGFNITGRADVKELRGAVKLFFTDIKIVQAQKVLTEFEKAKLVNNYKQEKKKKEDDQGFDFEDLAEDKKAEYLEQEKHDIKELYRNEIDRVLTQPKLHCYLTVKRAKAKMSDVHKTGTRIPIPGAKEGCFGIDNSLGDFEATLKDIPDVNMYQGMVIIKIPGDEPKTEEPVVFAMISLGSSRNAKIKSRNALHFQEVSDIIIKVQSLMDQAKGKKVSRKLSDNVKSLGVYSELANSGWRSLNLEQDEDVDFSTIVKLVDLCRIFLVETQIQRLHAAVDVQKNGKIDIIEFENFLIANDFLGPAHSDINILDIYDSLKMTPDAKFGEEGNHTGMDYAGFIEACNMLGVKNKTLEENERAFMYGGNLKSHAQIGDTWLDAAQFKRGWIYLCDLQEEFKKRNMKYEKGDLAQARNRDRLYRVIKEQEDAYFNTLSRVSEQVELLKHDRRARKDESRQEYEIFKSKLQHDADKFEALRGAEKRLQVKKEQEEKNKRRLEEKVLRNRLMFQQQQAKEKADAELRAQVSGAEKLRQDEIRAQGLDNLDLYLQAIREIPTKLYNNEAAMRKLTYVINCDISCNKIEHLPEKNFLYWLSECKKLKLNENHIYTLPNEITQMINLQIFEMNSNRLVCLPEGFGCLTSLQRLDISNNQITELPSSIGLCGALKYLNAHSNTITHLPSNLGACFKLEYIDLSHNHLHELPEDFEYLISLFHLDIKNNRIGHLHSKIGCSEKLTYIDASTNMIAYLPDTFSQLKSLEYVNFQNNDIIISANKFNDLISLKTLNLRKNNVKHIHSDIGGLRGLYKLDLSSNAVETIPMEMGLLFNLQELNLSYNKLKRLPVELGSCRELLELNINNNLISGPLSDNLGGIKTLRMLDISFNQITLIPASIIALKELHTISAHHCQLTSLPDTLSFLHNLHTIDVANNKFVHFPIDLKDVPGLKNLNLCDNLLELLPRNINKMNFLQYLNLAKNRLRALPIEFIECFESVPELLIHDNLWTDLPAKWGKLWPRTHSTDGPTGYNVTDATEFLYAVRVFYDKAEQLWEEKGAYHYTGRLSLDDFLNDLRHRLPRSWYEGLVEYVEPIYFQARHNGVYPRWYQLYNAEVRENKRREDADSIKRDYQLEKIRSTHEYNKKVRDVAYDVSNPRQLMTLTALAEEQRVGNQVLEHLALESLKNCLKTRNKEAEKRSIKQRRDWAKVCRQEAERLNELIK